MIINILKLIYILLRSQLEKKNSVILSNKSTKLIIERIRGGQLKFQPPGPSQGLFAKLCLSPRPLLYFTSGGGSQWLMVISPVSLMSVVLLVLRLFRRPTAPADMTRTESTPTATTLT